MRLIFDTGVVVSSLLLPRSVPWRAFQAARNQEALLVSLATLKELDDVLRRSKFDASVTEERRADVCPLSRTLVHVPAGSAALIRRDNRLALWSVCRPTPSSRVAACAWLRRSVRRLGPRCRPASQDSPCLKSRFACLGCCRFPPACSICVPASAAPRKPRFSPASRSRWPSCRRPSRAGDLVEVNISADPHYHVLTEQAG